MKIFLSYTGEDEQVSRKVAARLRDRGLEVFRWEDDRGPRVAGHLERQIREAGAFLVLMSRDYLNSDWCRRERDLAMSREQTMQRG